MSRVFRPDVSRALGVRPARGVEESKAAILSDHHRSTKIPTFPADACLPAERGISGPKARVWADRPLTRPLRGHPPSPGARQGVLLRSNTLPACPMAATFSAFSSIHQSAFGDLVANDAIRPSSLVEGARSLGHCWAERAAEDDAIACHPVRAILRWRRGPHRGLRQAGCRRAIIPAVYARCAARTGIGLVHQHFTARRQYELSPWKTIRSRHAEQMGPGGSIGRVAVARIRKLSTDLRPRPSTRWPPGLGSCRGRTPAGGDPEGALPRPRYPDPRRSRRPFA